MSVETAKEKVKLALVSTPRSGNTWLRNILAGLYGLEQFAVHDPASLDWGTLGDRAIVQLHWNQTPDFVQRLKDNDFRVVTIARHPLDVLISILHFAPNEPQTGNWLLGEGGNELSIHGMAPGSPAFLAYCLSKRADRLLSITPQWWGSSDVACVRYEDLVANPGDALREVTAQVQAKPVNLQAVLSGLTLEQLRKSSTNQHFWRGTPGLWRSLLTYETAHQIRAKNSAIFDKLGYDCDPDERLSNPQADSNWLQL